MNNIELRVNLEFNEKITGYFQIQMNNNISELEIEKCKEDITGVKEKLNLEDTKYEFIINNSEILETEFKKYLDLFDNNSHHSFKLVLVSSDVDKLIESLCKNFILLNCTFFIDKVELECLNIKPTNSMVNNNNKLARKDRIVVGLPTKNEWTEIQKILLDVTKIIDLKDKELEQLQAKYKKLEQDVENGLFNEKNIKFNEILEKYKDSQKRLNNLRNSRLGKLQIKYWDIKGW